MPQFAAAIEAQIDCDDASDDFIKEKLHSKKVWIFRWSMIFSENRFPLFRIML